MKNAASLILFFCFLSAQAQQKRTVIDGATMKPIPYATVKILRTEFGQIATANGEFELRIQPKDSVLISSVGYNDQILMGHDIGDIVVLKQRPSILEMVTVKLRKVAGKLMLGNGVDLIGKTIKCNYVSGADNDCLPWGPGASAEFAEAIDLPDSLKAYHINKVWLPIKVATCWQPIFFNIYESDSTGLPGNLIFQKHIATEPAEYKRGKLTAIDLSKENIYFDKTKRFFIGISWDESNMADACVTTIMLVKPPKGISYSRHLKSQKYTWFVFMQGKYNSVFAAEIEELKY